MGIQKDSGKIMASGARTTLDTTSMPTPVNTDKVGNGVKGGEIRENTPNEVLKIISTDFIVAVVNINVELNMALRDMVTRLDKVDGTATNNVDIPDYQVVERGHSSVIEILNEVMSNPSLTYVAVNEYVQQMTSSTNTDLRFSLDAVYRLRNYINTII